MKRRSSLIQLMYTAKNEEWDLEEASGAAADAKKRLWQR